ncbi:CIA30 family protein [Aestuariivita sp.]|jgi:hypothetical protein|uniref:CIA30 family protein n=1 Tax=Aestuariivita sp. TaxID=1872407 RepID=UPI003413A9F0
MRRYNSRSDNALPPRQMPVLGALLCTCLAVWGMMPASSRAQEADLQLTPHWEFVADTVMGGVSRGALRVETSQGRTATRLTGQVSLDNNGGFVQMAMDLGPGRVLLDASGYTGVEIVLRGNGERYDLRLRTDALTRPWQSFRTEFLAPPDWTAIRIPFSRFDPHRTEVRFDPARLRRVGILAIGREFAADISVASIGFYR